ncbi:hypothetical protein AAJCM20276_35860 (plasmid) [Acetobacter aceti]|uniref:Uncharacterized protein n=1 Tax=Acetobacter aceti TaxID=435 RepID=A0A6S6PWF5_ACEAC|nr:hypothetical protein AAJCM20276_35860 [Acetobacter aceti]
MKKAERAHECCVFGKDCGCPLWGKEAKFLTKTALMEPLKNGTGRRGSKK